jgi:hypothetical protein
MFLRNVGSLSMNCMALYPIINNIFLYEMALLLLSPQFSCRLKSKRDFCETKCDQKIPEESRQAQMHIDNMDRLINRCIIFIYIYIKAKVCLWPCFLVFLFVRT